MPTFNALQSLKKCSLEKLYASLEWNKYLLNR